MANIRQSRPGSCLGYGQILALLSGKKSSKRFMLFPLRSQAEPGRQSGVVPLSGKYGIYKKVKAGFWSWP